MKSALSPQDRALLALLADRQGGVAAAGLSGPEWDALAQRAFEHGVAPLLHYRLRDRRGIPSAVVDRLRRAFMESTVDAMRRFQHLGAALRLLHGAGIGVIVLKGAHLAHAAYEAPALRTMGDVDLLVRAGELERAKGVLLGGGFVQERLVPLELECEGLHHLAGFWDGKDPASRIELHRLLTPPRVAALDASGVWERARPARVAGREALALRTEDLLVHLALHACLQHNLAAGLQPLLDVDAVLRSPGPGLDQGALASRAAAWGAGRCLALVLEMAAALLETPVPEGLAARVAPEGLPPGLVDAALRQVFDRSGDSAYLSVTFTHLGGAAGVGARAAIVFKRLFPPGEELILRHGLRSRALLPLARAAHPFYLLARHAGAGARLLAGRSQERGAAAAARRSEELARALRSSWNGA